MLIEYNNVTKKFGANTVLNNIDLKIRQGELVALVGGSGAGKSTMFNMLLGSLPPSSGQVLLQDKVIDRVGPDRGIVPQKYSLYPNLKVLDNIAFGVMLSQTSMLDCAACVLPNYHNIGTRFSSRVSPLLNTLKLSSLVGVSKRVGSRVDACANFLLPKYLKVSQQAKEQVLALLPKLGLEKGDGDKYPFELSGGMQQRVAIGTAIIMRPKVLMMDEPFGALDPNIRSMMQQLTLQLWKEQNLTIIFVTHSMEEAVYMGTRVIGLSKYWSDEQGNPGQGATIVLDRQIPDAHPRPESFMETEAFHSTCTAIHRLVLDTNRRVPREQFDLSHPDAKPAKQAGA